MRWLGIVLFPAFAFVVLVDLFRFVFVAGLGLVLLPVKAIAALRGDRDALKGEGYMTAGSLVQGAEMIIFAIYIVCLYRVFF